MSHRSRRWLYRSHRTGSVAPPTRPPRDRCGKQLIIGFSDTAHLDEGAMWPSAFALTELTAADEARIGALVKKAVS
jgi:hypothetical protein